MTPDDDAQGRTSKEEVIGFPSGPSVDVREIDDKEWRVLAPFTYVASEEKYEVPIREKTDFASVPRVFVWFIPTYGRYTKAAILHDHLCRLAREGRFSRRDADGIFRQAMRTLGVAFLRRWIMWAAVRWGAVVTSEGRKDWHKDAWKVLLISLPVVPIVLPAAVVILLTLFVWHIVELAFWVPLTLAAAIKDRRGQPRKRVNPPRLSFRL
jgi:hypothetical protein